MIPDPQTLANNFGPAFESIGVLMFMLGGLMIMLPIKSKASSIWFFVLGVACAVLSQLDVRGWTALYRWLDKLPVWLLVLVGGFTALRLLGLFAAIFIGRRAATDMVSDLATHFVRFVLGAFVLPLRFLRRFMRGNVGGP